MPAAKINCTDKTKGPWRLSDVLTGVNVAGLTVTGLYTQLKPTCRQLRMRADQGNAGGLVTIGSNVAGTIAGPVLKADAEETWTDDKNTIGLIDKWISFDTNTNTLNVEWSYQ